VATRSAYSRGLLALQALAPCRIVLHRVDEVAERVLGQPEQVRPTPADPADGAIGQ
jgi:hypothetical protein